MVSHPLDSLTADEISATSALLAGEKGIDSGWRYASIVLQEPPKTEVKAALRNGECRRPTRSGGSEIDRGLSMIEVLTLAIRKTSTCLTLPSCPLI